MAYASTLSTDKTFAASYSGHQEQSVHLFRNNENHRIRANALAALSVCRALLFPPLTYSYTIHNYPERWVLRSSLPYKWGNRGESEATCLGSHNKYLDFIAPRLMPVTTSPCCLWGRRTVNVRSAMQWARPSEAMCPISSKLANLHLVEKYKAAAHQVTAAVHLWTQHKASLLSCSTSLSAATTPPVKSQAPFDIWILWLFWSQTSGFMSAQATLSSFSFTYKPQTASSKELSWEIWVSLKPVLPLHSLKATPEWGNWKTSINWTSFPNSMESLSGQVSQVFTLWPKHGL